MFSFSKIKLGGCLPAEEAVWGRLLSEGMVGMWKGWSKWHRKRKHEAAWEKDAEKHEQDLSSKCTNLPKQ